MVWNDLPLGHEGFTSESRQWKCVKESEAERFVELSGGAFRLISCLYELASGERGFGGHEEKLWRTLCKSLEGQGPARVEGQWDWPTEAPGVQAAFHMKVYQDHRKYNDRLTLEDVAQIEQMADAMWPFEDEQPHVRPLSERGNLQEMVPQQTGSLRGNWFLDLADYYYFFFLGGGLLIITIIIIIPFLSFPGLPLI